MKKNPIDFTAEFSDAMVSTYETWAEPLSARLEETIGAIADLIEAGFVKHVGLSEVGG